MEQSPPHTEPPAIVAKERTTAHEHASVRKTIQLRRKSRPLEFLAELGIKGVAFTSFAVIVLIFVFVFKEAAPVFSARSEKPQQADELPQETYGDDAGAKSATPPAARPEAVEQPATLENFAGTQWQPVSERPKFGLLPLIVGSAKVTLTAVFVGAPLAILAALYTAFFASRRLKELLKPAIEFLSGFPSVVIGFFALVELASVVQQLFGNEYRLNAFVGGLALSLAVIPIVYSVAEDALSSVPRYLTEASMALGASKWQTALFVVLPAATPGIFAALLLGLGRAFGETMIVLMATGNASLFSANMFEPVRTMSATIGAEMAEVVFGDTHYNVLFLIGAILFLFTFALNAVAEFYVRTRLQRRFGGRT
jgi:phosphate transport system permease protein